MELKYKEIENINEFIDAIRIRANVFIKEQGFEPGWEPDEDDKISRHFIAIVDNKIVGTGRFREIEKDEIKIERMAIKKEYRNKNIGKGLLEFMIKEIQKLKPNRIWARSQVKSQRFYEKNGFVPISEPYEIWGQKHIDLDYKINQF